MPKLIAVRPFQKFDLRDKFRPNPDAFPHIVSR
jgi:hypothetical protein